MHVRAATQNTRGVILAGQYAWKDSRFDALCPRPLLPVANQPLVSYALLWLAEGGLHDDALRLLGARPRRGAGRAEDALDALLRERGVRMSFAVLSPDALGVRR